MSAQTTQQIIDALFASREQELLNAISSKFGISMDELSKLATTNCAPEQYITIRPTTGPRAKTANPKKMSSTRNLPAQQRCMACTWGKGTYPQCTRRRVGINGEFEIYCRAHAKQIKEKGVLTNGSITQPCAKALSITSPSQENNEVIASRANEVGVGGFMPQCRSKIGVNAFRHNANFVGVENRHYYGKSRILLTKEDDRACADVQQTSPHPSHSITTSQEFDDPTEPIEQTSTHHDHNNEEQEQEHQDEDQDEEVEEQEEEDEDEDEEVEEEEEVEAEEITIDASTFYIVPSTQNLYNEDSEFIGKYQKETNSIDYDAQE